MSVSYTRKEKLVGHPCTRGRPGRLRLAREGECRPAACWEGVAPRAQRNSSPTTTRDPRRSNLVLLLAGSNPIPIPPSPPPLGPPLRRLHPRSTSTTSPPPNDTLARAVTLPPSQAAIGSHMSQTLCAVTFTYRLRAGHWLPHESNTCRCPNDVGRCHCPTRTRENEKDLRGEREVRKRKKVRLGFLTYVGLLMFSH